VEGFGDLLLVGLSIVAAAHESVREPGRVSPLWRGFVLLSANVLSSPPVANDRDRTCVVVVIESALLHGEERPVQENIVTVHRTRVEESDASSRILAVSPWSL
jgi:hypothetical protein